MRRSAARRVSNHEGTQVDRAPPILRSGRHSHDVKQRDLLPSRACVSSFPRRVYAPGFVFILSRPSPRGVGGAPTGALMLLSRVRGATDPRPAGRGASHDAGRSPLGAPPWQCRSENNIMISMVNVASVPIVSRRASSAGFSSAIVEHTVLLAAPVRPPRCQRLAINAAEDATSTAWALGLLVTCLDGCTERCKPHILRPTLSLSNIGGRSWRVAR
jgi:hypothetical protein